MAQDSSGSKNQPLYTEGGVLEIGTDFSAVSNYAGLVGNRRWGTTAERLALTSSERWVGMAFWDTDLGYKFIWDGSQWAGTVTYISDASSYFTMAANWTLDNAQLRIYQAAVYFRAHVVRSGSTLSGAPTNGNITNTEVLTITDPALRPYAEIALNLDNTGYLASFCAYATGIVRITATGEPGRDITVGTRFSFSGMWLRDVTAT